MTTNILTIATVVAGVGISAVGGICYAFSTIVMRGLDRTGPVEAITAMRGINAQANASAPFLLMFFVPSLIAIGIGVAAALRLGQPGNAYLLAGAIVAVVPALVTIVFNVPLNNRIDAVDPTGLSIADAAREWVAYLGPWTTWNHVRSAAGLAAGVLLALGLHTR